MTKVAVTQNPNIQQAIAQALDHLEAELSKMKFPAMSIEDAYAAFTKAAYGKRLHLEHA